MGRIIRKINCDSCGSKDNKCEYEDGTYWCFTPNCPGNKQSHTKGKTTMTTTIGELPYGTSSNRQISTKICELYGVRKAVSTDGDTNEVYYPYYENDKLVGYKQRLFPKDFRVVGKLPATLFGQQLFPQGGKRIVITEGEEDALAVAEAYNTRGPVYPVVSIPSASNIKAVIENRDYLRSFEEVILFIDKDTAGEAATANLATAIGYDKVKVAKTNFKDASDALTKGGPMELMRGIWDATAYNPQGILTGEALWERMIEYNNIKSVPYPDCLPGLNDKLKGMRLGEITLWVSGTGAGKSTLLREIALDLLDKTEDKVGIIALEESPADTTRKLSGMAIQKNPQMLEIPVEELRVGFETFGNRIMVLDHCGSMAEGLIEQLEYMALSGCRYLFIDHITILVSEGAAGLSGNEAIDKVMNDLLRITQQHNVWIGLVSHLRKSVAGGKSFEDGVMPSVDDIRGSGSIKQVAHDIIGFSRNITAEDEEERNKVTLSILKSRFTGQTGAAGSATYDYMTSRLIATKTEIEGDF